MIADAIWRHANTVYDAMKKDSKRVTVNGRRAQMWEGFATHLFSELQIPIPYYGKVLNVLKDMGCVTLARRGARSIESQWILYGKPTEAAYMKIRDKHAGSGNSKSRKSQAVLALEQQLADLKASLGGIDIPKALTDLQTQIDELKPKARKKAS